MNKETIWCENGCCESEGIVTRTKQNGTKMQLCSLCADAWDMGVMNELSQDKALWEAAGRIVEEFDVWGELCQDEDGEYGPTTAIETLRTVLEGIK